MQSERASEGFQGALFAYAMRQRAHRSSAWDPAPLRNILKDADSSEHERLRRKSVAAGANAERKEAKDEEEEVSSTLKKRKGAKDEEEEVSSTLKKQRVVWSVELHQQFVAAVNQLGIDKAEPKRILELMNVQGLTRENVAKHLQKYRFYLKRFCAVTQHQNSVPMSMTIGGEPSYNAVESLQRHPIISPGSSQALAGLRSAYLRTICSPRKSDEGDSVAAGATKDEEEEVELDMDDSSALEKPWSVELHEQFVTAVNQLGIDKAVPKRILELMNVQGLTRENVARHLQMYRRYLKVRKATFEGQKRISNQGPDALVIKFRSLVVDE